MHHAAILIPVFRSSHSTDEAEAYREKRLTVSSLVLEERADTARFSGAVVPVRGHIMSANRRSDDENDSVKKQVGVADTLWNERSGSASVAGSEPSAHFGPNAPHVYRELLVELRRSVGLGGESEAVALGHPIMPIGDGLDS
jgi:hypothetical protein